MVSTLSSITLNFAIAAPRTHSLESGKVSFACNEADNKATEFEHDCF
jgi:hypothetical protein